MNPNAEPTLGPILQVFISSATEGREPYRTAAIHAINEVGTLYKNYNNPRGAGFTQGKRTIFELNRETVRHSDVFVGLYGFGEVWKPCGHPGLRAEHAELLTDPEKLIMEYEYEWAQEAGLYMFPYVRTDATVDLPSRPMHPRMDLLRSRVMAGAVGWLTTDWVECGHNQHLRRNPHWPNRHWASMPQGRDEHIGFEWQCLVCLESPSPTDSS